MATSSDNKARTITERSMAWWGRRLVRAAAVRKSSLCVGKRKGSAGGGVVSTGTREREEMQFIGRSKSAGKKKLREKPQLRK